MKKIIFSSLLAVLLLSLCASKTFSQGDAIYSHVSLKNPPTYPGGIQKFYEFVGSTLKYPKAAIENNTQGTIHLSFTVEKDGSLTDVKNAGRILGNGTEEEAIRVVKLSKRWNPGMDNGKPVRVKYNIPVKFAMPGKAPKASVQNENVVTTTATKPGDDSKLYSHVSLENPPTYPGGIAKFYEFLGKNISYPKMASDRKIQGTVHVNFKIEKDGSLTEVRVDGKKLGAGLDEEAIRVVKLSKKWNPGMQNGRPVRTEYNIPVKFSM